jgi:hypothetical protein
MTAALRHAEPANSPEDGTLLWSGASVPTVASGANPLAESPPNAGVTTTITPGQSSDFSVTPCNEVTDAARAIGRRGGRPKGSYSPLRRWLRPQILKFKRQGHTCRNVFYGISLTEEMDGVDAFIVTAETADLYYEECFGDITGRRVTWSAFRKLWQRT